MDLVIFLDTAHALNSNWVYEELLQAESQGMGILQILWPGRQQDRATQFCDLLTLQRTDFEEWSPALGDPDSDPRDILTAARLAQIVQEVERTRIRSIRTRRDQVLTEIIDAVRNETVEANVNPTGSREIPVSFVEFRRPSGESLGIALPVIGFPDSLLLQNRHDSLKLQHLDLGTSCVVYDELGMTADLRNHLEWLNESLEIRTVPATSISHWLEGLT